MLLYNGENVVTLNYCCFEIVDDLLTSPLPYSDWYLINGLSRVFRFQTEQRAKHNDPGVRMPCLFLFLLFKFCALL